MSLPGHCQEHAYDAGAALGRVADALGPVDYRGIAHCLLQQDRLPDHYRQRIVQFMCDACEKRAEHRHLFVLIESFALTDQLLLSMLSVRNVHERADQSDRAPVGIDDEAAQKQPARRGGGGARADLELEPAALPGKSILEILLQGCKILRHDFVEQIGDRSFAVAAASAEDLVQARRKVRPVGGEVPVPQSHIGASCGQCIAFVALPQPRFGRFQFGYVVNGADEAHERSRFVPDRLGTLVHDADLAVGPEDAIFDIERHAGVLGAGIRLRDPSSVVGMNALQGLGMGPGGAARLESKDAPAFFRPRNLAGVEIELPAADMGNALRLDQLIVSLAQPLVSEAAFDGSRNQGGCGFQEIDFHVVPNPFALAVVEAERAPKGAIHHDGH